MTADRFKELEEIRQTNLEREFKEATTRGAERVFKYLCYNAIILSEGYDAINYNECMHDSSLPIVATIPFAKFDQNSLDYGCAVIDGDTNITIVDIQLLEEKLENHYFQVSREQSTSDINCMVLSVKINFNNIPDLKEKLKQSKK